MLAVFSLGYDRLKQGHDNNNKMEPFLVTNYITLDLINLLGSPFYLIKQKNVMLIDS